MGRRDCRAKGPFFHNRVVMYGKVTITGQTGPPCLLRVSDLESASLAGYCRAYAVQSVHAPLSHRFEFSYWRAGITIGRICPLAGSLSETPSRSTVKAACRGFSHGRYNSNSRDITSSCLKVGCLPSTGCMCVTGATLCWLPAPAVAAPQG